MLATATSAGTWIAGGTLFVMFLPIYFLTLKAANSYGRLEQKVDTLAEAQAETARQNANTAALAVLAMTKLSDAFTTHALSDAQNFGEIKGWMNQITSKTPPTV